MKFSEFLLFYSALEEFSGWHAHLSRCWRDTWSDKGWEPLL